MWVKDGSASLGLEMRFPRPFQGVTADRSCFAFCRVGFVAEQGAVEWICADGGSAALTEPVNGFALRGVIPSCVAQVCNLSCLNKHGHQLNLHT